MNYEMFFDINTISKGHHNVTYRGIKTIKCPFDYVIYQMMIFDLKPDLIIEVGTNHGGSALYMADMLDLIGKGEIHTIDIKEYEMNSLVLNHPRIKRFLGGYNNYDINLTKGFKNIIFKRAQYHWRQFATKVKYTEYQGWKKWSKAVLERELFLRNL